MTTTPDPIMADIFAAHALLQGGDRAGARRDLEAVWARIEADPDPMHECTLAHYMADAQDNPADELAWDHRALDAGLRCTDNDAWRHSQVRSIAAFMPSLHLSLAEDYFKFGDMPHSRHHLALAREFAGKLADDAYGQTIRERIERMPKRLDPPAAVIRTRNALILAMVVATMGVATAGVMWRLAQNPLGLVKNRPGWECSWAPWSSTVCSNDVSPAFDRIARQRWAPGNAR
jgi:hypothetical protein